MGRKIQGRKGSARDIFVAIKIQTYYHRNGDNNGARKRFAIKIEEEVGLCD